MTDDNLYNDNDQPSDNLFTPDFSDTHEEILLPANSEALVQIRTAERSLDKNGNPYFRFGLSVTQAPGHEDSVAFVKDISFFLFLPNVRDDAKGRNRKNLRIRDFMQAIGLDTNAPFQLEDLVGMEAWAILGVEESEQYGDSNRIKRWVKGA